MIRRKFNILLIIFPLLAIVTLVFVFSQTTPIELENTKYYWKANNKNVVSSKPELEDILYFKTVDEHLVYLRDKISNEKGVFGVFIKDLETDEEYLFNSDETFYGASLYKIPIAVGVLKEYELGNIALGDQLAFTYYDHSSGTGSIANSPYGTKYTIGAVLDYLMRQSDNSGQLMLEHLLGEPRISQIFRDLTPEKNLNKFYELNISNPEEVGYVIENIFYGDYLNKENKERLLDLMYPTLFDDRITPYLEKDLTFYHKIGTWPESWHDCGIVSNNDKQVIVCLMSKETDYSSFLKVSNYIGSFINSLF